MKSVEDCYKKVKSNCFKFIFSQETKENKFNCGAERVITPADTFIISIMPTTGSIISDAAINIDPAAFIPAPINTIGGGIEPIGRIE